MIAADGSRAPRGLAPFASNAELSRGPVSGPRLPARSGLNLLKTRRFLQEQSWLSVRSKAGGGAEGNRTTDLDIANVALSQLSSGLQADTRGPNTNGRFGSPSQVRDRAEDVGCC